MFAQFYKRFYITAIFMSALLLFMVQPMIAKMILPELGGSPAVWQTVMLFFQILLLIGYGYVHFSTQFLSLKQQINLHRVLCLAVFAFMPLSLVVDIGVDRNQYPVLWLFQSLFYSVSVPFFVLSTTAPLLQRWYSIGNHENANNPYFLYSASNIGSLVALLSYPFVLEPMMGLKTQTLFWTGIYSVFFVLLLYISLFVKDVLITTPIKQGLEQIKNLSKPTIKQLGLWIFYSFVPSSLMLGITTFITTDIASLPLLWIIPFALYLISFIFVFNSKMIGYRFSKRAFPFVVVSAIFLTLFISVQSLIVSAICYFIIIIRYHGQLVETKPQAENLTYFYLCMSIGGALGGVFNALIAPNIFTSAYEYQLILALSALIIPFGHLLTRAKLFFATTHFLFILMIAFFAFALNQFMPVDKAIYFTEKHHIATACIIIGFASAIILFRKNGLFLGSSLLAIYGGFQSASTDNVLFKERNFFGVSRIVKDEKNQAMIYLHGTTNHGMQSLLPKKQLELQSYYNTTKDYVLTMPDKLRDKPMAVVGLGAGTLSCYGKKGQQIDLYEIDPIVISIAQNNQFFSYLSGCKGDKNVILGDARINLDKASAKKYGMMFMDAYSSDALPIHLLTKEAVGIYLSKLDDDGVIAFNISNRHLELLPVLATIAKSYHLTAYHRLFGSSKPLSKDYLITSNEWIVMSRNPSSLDALANNKEWQNVSNYSKNVLWTDNYSSIFSIIK